MSRYIDAKNLTLIKNLATLISESEVIDIVRCWECKYWNTQGKYYDKCEYHGIVSMKANDYCSYGERKE